MIDRDYLRTLAAYNSWQNASLYGAAEGLRPAEREKDRGAFFGSIAATLNHILWADQIWVHRFGAAPPPPARTIAESTTQYPWDELRAERSVMDRRITEWAETLDPAWLAGAVTWFSGAAGRQITRPAALLAVHLFNHQTHHRGQVHAMLTAAGCRLEATDLPFMPAEAGRRS